ncbi:hypothetical protein EDD85DRAFT_576204 [Armillaria nabsnona]|nr:hypothetical protein EDD85DRAFT_576204 [Armillaria nabsnona]
MQESHSVVLMRRRLTTDPLSGDKILLDFRSAYVAERAWNKLWELEHDESLKYLALFGQHSALSIAGGWAFENIAYRYMCQITPTRPNFPPMHLLDYSAGPTFTKIIGSTPSHSLPVYDEVRRPIYYSMASEVKFDLSAYYIPRRTNNPLFDALFFGPNIMDVSSVSSPFALYVLQMSTATVHGGSDKGVDIIYDLLRANPSIKPIFVLVVPDSAPHAWRMPSGWYSKCQGPVFCQEVPLVRSIPNPVSSNVLF